MKTIKQLLKEKNYGEEVEDISVSYYCNVNNFSTINIEQLERFYEESYKDDHDISIDIDDLIYQYVNINKDNFIIDSSDSIGDVNYLEVIDINQDIPNNNFKIDNWIIYETECI